MHRIASLSNLAIRLGHQNSQPGLLVIYCITVIYIKQRLRSLSSSLIQSYIFVQGKEGGPCPNQQLYNHHIRTLPVAHPGIRKVDTNTRHDDMYPAVTSTRENPSAFARHSTLPLESSAHFYKNHSRSALQPPSFAAWDSSPDDAFPDPARFPCRGWPRSGPIQPRRPLPREATESRTRSPISPTRWRCTDPTRRESRFVCAGPREVATREGPWRCPIACADYVPPGRHDRS